MIDRESDEPEVIDDSDRDTLRWAAREMLPCVVVLPGRRIWGRSYVIDLREGGPRPALAVAQPSDLLTRELRPLQAGESVRIWSVRDSRPFTASGFVLGAGVAESRSAGPVVAASVRLPRRLFESGSLLFRSVRTEGVSLRISAAVLDEDGPMGRTTLLERWLEPAGAWSARGGGHLVELSRRSLTLSLARADAPALLPGARLELQLELPDDGLRTTVEARVDVAHRHGDQVLVGMALGDVGASTSADEHREVVRRLGALI
ncbi:MAG: hypothetical protein KDA24_04890 [Deltaproteobacteria bacterium]|nr:hypothetical protein [Deltaproteobacteria bacterium]